MQQVSIIGGTGDGGPLPSPPSGTVAVTPAGMADIRLNVVPPIIALAVRFAYTFLTAFAGVIGADVGEGVVGVDLFSELGVVKTGIVIGLSAGGAGFLKDLITVFGRLENKYPLITGSI